MNEQNVCVFQLQRQMHEINHILPHTRFFAVHICILFVLLTKKYRNEIIWLCSKEKIDFTPFLFCFDYIRTQILSRTVVFFVLICLSLCVRVCVCAYVFGRFYRCQTHECAW